MEPSSRHGWLGQGEGACTDQAVWHNFPPRISSEKLKFCPSQRPRHHEPPACPLQAAPTGLAFLTALKVTYFYCYYPPSRSSL